MDWLTSEKMAVMELYHIGAYINLLSREWTTGICTLPSDEIILKKLCKWDDQKHTDFHLVLACFEPFKKTTRIYNPRLYKEWLEANDKSVERRESGLKGAQKRWAEKQAKTKTPKTAPIPIEDWLTTIKANPAYQHLSIDTELAKMDAWLSTKPGRKKTKSFVVNWLNKIEAPMTNGSGKQKPPPPPPKNDPIGRGLWGRTYGRPQDHGYE